MQTRFSREEFIDQHKQQEAAAAAVDERKTLQIGTLRCKQKPFNFPDAEPFIRHPPTQIEFPHWLCVDVCFEMTCTMRVRIN